MSKQLRFFRSDPSFSCGSDPINLNLNPDPVMIKPDLQPCYYLEKVLFWTSLSSGREILVVKQHRDDVALSRSYFCRRIVQFSTNFSTFFSKSELEVLYKSYVHYTILVEDLYFFK